MNGTASKKGIKNFTFLSRKLQHTASKESSPERGRPTISNPRRLHAALDDPVLPIMISMPTPRTSTRSEGSTNSAQSTPTKSRKRIQHVGSDDLSLFTGKSSGSKVLVKPNSLSNNYLISENVLTVRNIIEKKGQDEDSGYVSEGTGLSSLKSKARRKGKYSTSPPPDRKKIGVQSAATTQQQQKSTDSQSSVPVPTLPIAERFVRKKPSVPQPLKIPQIKFPPPFPPPPPPTDKVDNGNGNISLPNSSFLVVGSTPQFPNAKNSPISDKSFVMVPDLNIMKRLGLDKYVSGINASSGAIGANNEIKLQVMEMLLKNSKDSSPELKKKKSENTNSSIAEVTTEPIPAINVVPPHTAQESINATSTGTAKVEYQFLPPPTPIIRGRDSPFPKAPIRGKEPPFPTKPIFPGAMMMMANQTAASSLPVSRSRSPSAVRGGPGPLRFKLPSLDGYSKNTDIDLPRSVRSSYEKDLEREEKEAPSSSISDRVKARRAVANVNANSGRGGEHKYDYDVDLDSPSVYSSHFEIDSLAGRRI